MTLFDRIKKRFSANNNNGPEQKESGNHEDSVMKEIDNTMIDADCRIKEMLKEMRGQ